MTIPGFDKKAYGDPTRRGPGQRSNTRTESERDLNPPSRHSSEPVLQAETVVTSNLNHIRSEEKSRGSQTSPPSLTPFLPSSQIPSTHSTEVRPADQGLKDDKLNEDRRRSLTTISKMNSAEKARLLGRPETFETLKQGNENADQVITRLQAKGLREVTRRIQQKDHGENITTTGVSMLDFLRSCPQPDSERSQQRGATFPASPFQDPNHSPPRDQSTRNRGQLSSFNPPESNQVGKAKRWPSMNKKNPAQWSNAEACEEPESDNDSTKPMASGFGRLIHSRIPEVAEDDLAGWDGNFQPAPLEWEHRPSFSKLSPGFIANIHQWLGANTMRTMAHKPKVEFSTIPTEEVKNIDNHADGIGFTSKETVIDINNAERYGFAIADLRTLGVSHPADFDNDAKLDLSDPDNACYKDETAQVFIDKHMECLGREAKEEKTRMVLPVPVESENDIASEQEITQRKDPGTPIAMTNIYLRPAVSADIRGMKAILNWHIAQGVRPSELSEITDDDMHQRLDLSTQARLPYIVAVERNRKNTRTKSRKAPRVNPNHPIQNIDPNYDGLVKDEPIVGWAAATDWSASDYVETITAELELYVAPGHRKSGVGRCLMDALLDATDRGYLKKGGYEFRVAPEIKHLYCAGGGRDLHKLIFQVRSFNKPMSPQHLDGMLGASQRHADFPTTKNGLGSLNKKGSGRKSSFASAGKQEKRKDYSAAAKLDDREDDYEIWLKQWLERQGFEQEAHLKKLGTKNGRFVDVRYMTRETCWQPTDHRLPDYSKGF
ncbi:hypothetical protein AYL99_00760 [Fonsecaea erecta]|uniref:N-acetyltransferase domain-containing protein n=1 Tax=Fonsecaea erecta TaxID=1367422 RepID=A0A178ZYA6_9EURO|nr:hypothetical protein AYL99_00760 [Fonsecaea erecta]OAP64788.1 hypothetical protein AYL99_00760 [Fonsecaea erecta]